VQLFLYMALFFKRHPVAVLYCGVIGVLRTLSEGHAIYQLFTHPDMTAAEAFSSAICSHLMTPAINAALAILQVSDLTSPQCKQALQASCLDPCKWALHPDQVFERLAIYGCNYWVRVHL